MNVKDLQSLMGGIELSQYLKSMEFWQQTWLSLNEACVDYALKDLPKAALTHWSALASTLASATSKEVQ